MATIIGVCTLQLSIPSNHDLKSKRRVLQSVTAKLRATFNVAVAEVDDHDKWQAATLAIVAVATDTAYVHGLLTKAVAMIEQSRLDAVVADYDIEMM